VSRLFSKIKIKLSALDWEVIAARITSAVLLIFELEITMAGRSFYPDLSEKGN
jgi:hypothetical protein